jgi:prefoldin beta subunit
MVPNPGTVLASAVDAEIAKFHEIQDEVAKQRSDLQFVLGQRTENEMVLQELMLLGDSSVVYKKIGPVLIKQDLDDAQQTVKKRLEYIGGEREKLETKIVAMQKQGNEIAGKVQQMQAKLQQVTAEAVRAVTQQHGAS